jgi:hypothetical protein
LPKGQGKSSGVLVLESAENALVRAPRVRFGMARRSAPSTEGAVH